MSVFLISGKQGSGKTTLANTLERHLRNKGLIVKRIKFADSIYSIHDAARDKARELGVPYPDKFGSLLQVLGTDLGRNVFGDDIWIESAKSKLGPHDNVIIDDCRFENELNAFNHMGAVKIRLDAPEDVRKSRAEGWRDNTNHASETGLDHIHYSVFDFVFWTDGQLTPDQMVEVILYGKTKDIPV